MTPVIAYIGLGSNLDKPPRQLRRALDALAALPKTTLLCQSAFYLNPPMQGENVPAQADYVNAIAGLRTSLTATALLHHLQHIETRQGRIRNPATRWGPRTLDLDIIVYGNHSYHDANLRIPHPGLTQRAFVLYPLHDCAPDLILPDGQALTQLLAACPADDLIRLDNLTLAMEDDEANYPQYAAST